MPESNRKRSGLRLLAGIGVVMASATLGAGIGHAQQMAAQTDQAPLQQDKPRKPSSRSVVAAAVAGPNGPASGAAAKPVRRSSVKGPYYVDFRARTAASYGHAFVWYGKTSEKQVEVAGLHPAGDVLPYVLGHLTWVPSETGASYGDLDEQYLTASYRVYLSEADANKVFAYIKHLQATSPLWNAETTNCTAFIGRIANFMGLKAPFHLLKPEEYVNQLREINGGRQTAQLAASDQ
ncbi:hypothetical protein [Bradyrhizobium oropedii]|uniref:hypothetical protein n=1 Tax=Bradyrhizobium oropedii TaxID=1571201 RepID=UPI003B846B43